MTAVCRFRCWYEGKQLKELEHKQHNETRSPYIYTTAKAIHFKKLDRQVNKTKAKNTSLARCKLTAVVCDVKFLTFERKEWANLSSVPSAAPTVTVNTASDNKSSFSGLITGAVGGLLTVTRFNSSPVNSPV